MAIQDWRSNPCDLTGRCAVVTGAGRGIGAAVVRQLVAAGARVIAVARTAADLDVLAAEHPQQVEPWVFDAGSPGFLEQLEAHESLDILVSNAGANQPQPFCDVDDATLDRVLELNVRTAFRVARAAAHAMRRHGRGGSIVHMSSQMGQVGSPNRTVYCMTKHAVEGLSKAMAVELAPAGIRSNCVAPTFVETEMTRPMLADPAFRDFVLGSIPLGRMARPEEVAAAVLYLASPAAAMVTGTSLKVDGGWTAR